MRGNIWIVSETGWAVSNDAVLDYHKELVDTADGTKSIGYSMFEVINPFNPINKGEMVKVAFQAEDGKNVSYRGQVDRVTESRVFIKVSDQINEYKQIIERVLKWQD